MIRLVLACFALAFAVAASANAQLPTVAIVTTGGTIAQKTDPETGGAVPAVSGSDLVQAVPGLDRLAKIEVFEVVNIDSSQMTPEIWARVSRKLGKSVV